MNSHEAVELEFWKTLYYSKKDYREFRASELKKKIYNFDEFEKVKGLGLDVGCGLISILDGSGKDFIAGDLLKVLY